MLLESNTKRTDLCLRDMQTSVVRWEVSGRQGWSAKADLVPAEVPPHLAVIPCRQSGPKKSVLCCTVSTLLCVFATLFAVFLGLTKDLDWALFLLWNLLFRSGWDLHPGLRLEALSSAVFAGRSASRSSIICHWTRGAAFRIWSHIIAAKTCGEKLNTLGIAAAVQLSVLGSVWERCHWED